MKEKPRNPVLLFTPNKELLLIAFGDFFGNFFRPKTQETLIDCEKVKWKMVRFLLLFL